MAINSVMTIFFRDWNWHDKVQRVAGFMGIEHAYQNDI